MSKAPKNSLDIALESNINDEIQPVQPATSQQNDQREETAPRRSERLKQQAHKLAHQQTSQPAIKASRKIIRKKTKNPNPASYNHRGKTHLSQHGMSATSAKHTTMLEKANGHTSSFNVVIVQENQSPLFDTYYSIAKVVRTNYSSQTMSVKFAKSDVIETIPYHGIVYAQKQMQKPNGTKDISELESKVLGYAVYVFQTLPGLYEALEANFQQGHVFPVEHICRRLFDISPADPVQPGFILATYMAVACCKDSMFFIEQRKSACALEWHNITTNVVLGHRAPSACNELYFNESYQFLYALRDSILRNDIFFIRKAYGYTENHWRAMIQYIEALQSIARKADKFRLEHGTRPVRFQLGFPASDRSRRNNNRYLTRHLEIAFRKKITALDANTFLKNCGIDANFESSVLRICGVSLLSDMKWSSELLNCFRKKNFNNRLRLPSFALDKNAEVRENHTNPVFCIDNHSNIMDPDDGVSIDDDGNRIHIHITDVSRYLESLYDGENIIRHILEQYRSLYIAELDLEHSSKWKTVGVSNAIDEQGNLLNERCASVIPMIPAELTSKVLGLGAIYGTGAALTCSITFNSETTQIQTYQFCLTQLTGPIIRLSYQQANALIGENLNVQTELGRANQMRLRRIVEIMTHMSYNRHQSRLVKLNTTQTLSVQDVVKEMMITINSLAGTYMSDNQIPGVFRGSNAHSGTIRNNVNPLPHPGLMVQTYCQISSPIRRGFDLLNHINLKQGIRNMHLTMSDVDYPFSKAYIQKYIECSEQTEEWYTMAEDRIKTFRMLKRLNNGDRIQGEYVGHIGVEYNPESYDMIDVFGVDENGQTYGREPWKAETYGTSASNNSDAKRIFKELREGYGNNIQFAMVLSSEREQNYNKNYLILGQKPTYISINDYTTNTSTMVFSDIEAEMNRYKCVVLP